MSKVQGVYKYSLLITLVVPEFKLYLFQMARSNRSIVLTNTNDHFSFHYFEAQQSRIFGDFWHQNLFRRHERETILLIILLPKNLVQLSSFLFKGMLACWCTGCWVLIFTHFQLRWTLFPQLASQLGQQISWFLYFVSKNAQELWLPQASVYSFELLILFRAPLSIVFFFFEKNANIFCLLSYIRNKITIDRQHTIWIHSLIGFSVSILLTMLGSSR